jgi:hypothetical protein
MKLQAILVSMMKLIPIDFLKNFQSTKKTLIVNQALCLMVGFNSSLVLKTGAKLIFIVISELQLLHSPNLQALAHRVGQKIYCSGLYLDAQTFSCLCGQQLEAAD